jgi:sugar phosphate isomerase/epimerase
MRPEQIAVSPCSNPEMQLDEALAAYSSLGYRNFEVFTSWAKSMFDYHADAEFYLAKGRQYGMAFTSLHLPEISADNIEETLQEAIDASRFAEAIAAEVVLYKASDRPTYIKAVPAFLDAVENLKITPVIQNHFGSPLTTLEDVKEVYEGIDDPRMKTLLEVGHFHNVGVNWRDAAEYLGDSIALVHVKDQIGSKPMQFGKGEIDLLGLFKYMDEKAYTGRYVIEMEVRDENTLNYLADARRYVLKYCEQSK